MDTPRRGLRGWWIVVGVLALGALVAGILFTGATEPSAAPSASPTAAAGDDCGGVEAQYIDLDTQVVSPEPRMCFVLDERAQVTVGAAALEPDELIVLTLRDLDGAALGEAASESEWDPELAVTLEAGIYIVEVTGVSAPAPAFLVYTATFPAVAEEPVDATAIPPVDACGVSVSEVADDAPVTVEAAEEPASAADGPTNVYACFVVAQPSFVKVGLASPDPNDQDAPDLQLALYRYADEPVLVRTADDAIGFDPEMSVWLESGTYAVEASAWFDGPTGAMQIYVDDDADLFRHGTVTPMHAGLTPDVCADAPRLSPGSTVTVEGERTYVCLDIATPERLTLEAATLTDQDLVLEVMGFEPSGTPYRLLWADASPYAEALADFDPLLDATIPAGQWVVAVTTYFTGTAADYDVRLVPTENTR